MLLLSRSRSSVPSPAVGLLSGGYGRVVTQRERASGSAYRVYDDPADLLAHLDGVGVRRPL